MKRASSLGALASTFILVTVLHTTPAEAQQAAPPEDEQQQVQPGAAEPERGEPNERMRPGAPEGELAYAEEGLFELGGRFVLDIREDLVDFAIQAFFGYFIVDNFQLALIPSLRVVHVEQDTAYSVGGFLEPSYHFPLSDYVFGLVGLGVGVTYEDGPGFEVFIRPVVGADIRVGRSGIFKPIAFMDVGLLDGIFGGGFAAQFTIML